MNKELLRGIWLVNKACRFAPEIIGRGLFFRAYHCNSFKKPILQPQRLNIFSNYSYCKDPDKEDKESETDLKEQKSEDYYLPDKDEVLQALIKSLHDDFKVDPTKKETPSETKSKSNDSENKDNNLNLSLQDKFKVYTDENFEVVLSHEEQEYCIAQKYSEGEEPEYTIYPPKKTAKHFENKRGTTGVFDLEDFVSILRQEKVLDIAVIQIPEERDYGTYMVLGTGLSPRHLNGTMELVNKLYKARKNKKDPFTKIEGKKCDDWKVLNMGNIIFHLFLSDTRTKYDLEMLWTVGPELDPQILAVDKDPLTGLLEPHLQFLNVATPNQ